MKDESRDRGDASTSQQMPKITNQALEARGEAWSHSPSWPPKEPSNPTGTLMSDFRPPELRDRTFLLFKPPGLWCLALATLAN